MKEKLYKYEIPTYTYFYSPVLLDATLKEMGHYIVGNYYGHLVNKSNDISMIVVQSPAFSESGDFFLDLLIKNNQEFTDRLFQLINEITILGDKFQEKYAADISDNKVSDINEFYPDYIKVFSPLIGLGYALDYSIDQYLKKHNIEFTSIKPFGNSFLSVEKFQLRKIFEIIDEKEQTIALKKHCLNYSWLLNNYVGNKELSVDYFINRKQEVHDFELLGEINIEYKKPETLFEWFSLLVYVRDERKRVNMIAIGLMNRYLKSECERLNINYNNAVLCTVDEFELLKEKKIPERNERFLKFTCTGPVDITESEWVALLETNLESTGEIKGTIACKGIATGKVKIVLSVNDFSKVEKDDIIVASMTRPDFAPILGRCSAIVTNEGGITCHAAIVSRELKIPCIIGTMDATKILKDGDIVEVDADKGIVRILDKNGEEEWFIVSSRGKPHAILTIDSIGVGISKDYVKKIYGIDYKIKKYRQFDAKRSFGKGDYDNLIKILNEEQNKNPLLFFEFGSKIEKIAKEIKEKTDKLKKNNWDEINNLKLSTYIESMTDLQSKLWSAGLLYSFYFYFNDIFFPDFIEKLKNKTNNFDDELMEFITNPEKLTFIGEEQLNILNLANMHIQKKDIRKQTFDHWKKYAFLKRYYFWGEGFSLEEIKSRINSLSDEGASQIKERMYKVGSKQIDISKYHLNDFESKIIKSARKCSYAINLADEVTNYYSHELREMFYTIANRIGINYEQLVSMRLEEIIESLKKGASIVIREDLDERLKEHALIYENGSCKLLIKKELEEYKKNHKTIEENVGILRGTITKKFSKNIYGKVKIITDLKNISNFKKEEILVTTMTTPAYVPIMEKAAAIITDEGGLLCHAAIVSRELGVPCVIGTKVATKTLKDGDLIEIDADNGIVKIIK